MLLIIEDTVIDPALPPDTLPIKPTFCIKLTPVGFVRVKPPPGFTYIVSPTVGVDPSIGDVVMFKSSPVTTTYPKALFIRSDCKSPIAAILSSSEASATAISITAVAPTLPVW